MKLIVGLGNKGKEYEQTRHNIGFMAVDRLATYLNETFNKEKFGGIYFQTVYNGEKIIVLKPQKYINLSGEVIASFVRFYKIDIDDIFIIHDDLDLNIGKIKLKISGSSGGHNGLKNIELHLKTKNYKRLKIGISNDKNIDTKNYVLSSLSIDDKKIIDQILDIIPNLFKDYMDKSFDFLMNKYNRR